MNRRPRTSHLNQRLSKVAARLDDHKMLLGIVVFIVGAFLAYVAFVSTTGPPFQSRYEIKVEVPADAPVLRRGQEVRVAGKLAGLISEVEPDRDNGGTLVTANITKTEFRPLGQDARANVRVHSIVYRTFLELFPGDTSDPMESGDVIEQAQVSSGVDILEVVQLFDEEARESLRETVVNLGYGVAGRGTDLNQSNADLPPTAKNLNRQLEEVTGEPGAISDGIKGAAETTSGLEGERTDDVASLVESGAEVVGAVADRPTELGETLRRLRPFEDEFLATAPIAEPLFDDLAATAVELEPAVRGLSAALPDINRLLGLGDTLEDETRRITAVTLPLLRSTRPLVRDIYPTVAALNPLLEDVDVVVDGITPYADDISIAGTGLAEATSVRYPVGQGVGAGAPMGRVIPVFTCHSNRNPFPGPGEGVEDSASC